MIFPMGRVADQVIACIGALVFSGFIIYDTDNLIKRFNYDEYIQAAACLYLDIINLFLSLLALFGDDWFMRVFSLLEEQFTYKKRDHIFFVWGISSLETEATEITHLHSTKMDWKCISF